MLKIKFDMIPLARAMIIAGIFAALSLFSLNFFETIEKHLYSIGTRFALSSNLGASQIAIVNIDEKSIKQLGPWPWPRRNIAEMVEILKSNGARFIGLDLLYSDKSNDQGMEEVKGLYNEIASRPVSPDEGNAWILERLKEIEEKLDNDSILNQAVKESGNVILPVFGKFEEYKTGEVLSTDSFLYRNQIDFTGDEALKDDFIPVNELTTPHRELAENSFGLGHINLFPVESLSGRVHLLFFDYREHVIPSMSLRLAMDYLGVKDNSLPVKGGSIQLAGKSIPAAKGEMIIKFKGAVRSFPYYSFVDILNVKQVPKVFNNKIVLIGYTGPGAPTVDTPVDHAMPRVEYTANVIEDLLSGRCLKRPSGMIFLELILLFLIISFCSFVLSETSHLNRICIVLFFLLFVIFTGVFFFIAFDIWFKTVYICLALIVLYVELLVRDIVVSQRAIGASSKEMMASNRMLGLSFQSQGLLDLAFEKFRNCPLDGSIKDVIYNLGLDYERKRMTNKAVAVYEYIAEEDREFRDLRERIPKLRKVLDGILLTGLTGKKEDKIIVVDDLGIKPTVGRYEIIKEIGKGAMGIVYEARDPKIQRRLAIKTIRFSDEVEEDKLDEVKGRFLHEAEIAGKLSHPSIVSIYDVGEDYDLTYLAMEYLEGDDLRKYCSVKSLLPLRQVLHIINEVALALDYSHIHGVIHRDIKPGNIMLLSDGKVKVTDFGIAKAVSVAHTKSGVVMGTPNYMSPEQINGHEIDGRSDLFSLGVVMFEMLTGDVPFHGKNITNLLYEITQARHPSIREINPKIPRVCEQITDKALEKDPVKRFQSGEEFSRYLQAMIKKMDELGNRARGQEG